MKTSEPNFYYCEKCNVILEAIQGDKEDLTSSGMPFRKLTANTSEGAREKHLPVVKKEGNKITVTIGDVIHPMAAEHHISWIYLKTEKGCQRVMLESTQQPVVEFLIADGDTAIAAYAYCNLHGFWKTDIQ
ncbi:MAG: desulfoferrodoxin family protein [Oscillospiraceae bacterium]